MSGALSCSRKRALNHRIQLAARRPQLMRDVMQLVNALVFEPLPSSFEGREDKELHEHVPT